MSQTNEERKARWEPSVGWNILILFLSAYVIFALLHTFVRPQSQELNKILCYGDTVACVFFLIDVFLRWMAAPDRLAFWKLGWIDLIASIPNVAPARWGRLFQALRIIRGLRAIMASVRISEYFFKERYKSTFAMIATVLFLSIEISSVLMLQFESDAPNANIKNASDALWWAVNTITTVGSGDVYPVTEGGRIVAMIMMFVGISLFTSAIAITSSFFIDAKTGRYHRGLDLSNRENDKK